MELLLFIVVGLVIALPISVVWLVVRHFEVSRRLSELESIVRTMELRAAMARQPKSAPQESEIPSAISPISETPIYPEPSTPGTLIEGVRPVTTEELLPPAQEIPPVWSAYKPAEVSPEPAGVEEAPVEAIPEPGKIVDWEKFLGVKLFAWVGGLALFLGIAFFIKYSFEHNLVPPEVRVALGFLTGIGLVVGGVLMRRKEYSVTSQTLCATGVVALYAVSFGAHAVYHLLGSGTVFGLMSLITVAAFMLAVRLDAKVVAVLGLLGGFLTPPLLSTGQDNPVGLFGYVTLINIGLLAVAFHRRWHFLILLGAIATGIMELGWLLKYFTPEKTWTAVTILALFNTVQVIGYFLSERWEQSNQHSVIGPIIQSGVTFITGFYFLGVSEMAGRPGAFLVTVLLGNLAFLLLPLKRDDLFRLQAIGGGSTFLALAAWIGTHFREQQLYWALGATLFFAILHSVYPLVLQRRRKIPIPPAWLNVFPLASLGLMMFTLVQLSEVSLMVWPIVFALDLLVIGLAFLTGSLLSAFAAIVLTGLVTMTWILRIPGDLAGGGAVLLIGLFAVLFFAAGIWLGRKALESIDAGEDEPETQMRRYLPAASAILPFLLLALMIVRFDVANPSNIFGLGFLLTIMLLWLGRRINGDELGIVALGASLFLEFFWHMADYRPEQSGIALGWYAVFYALFMVHPFLFRRELQSRRLPWVPSALSGPLHFT